jgi:RNA-directed DNA polymerase
MSRIARKVKEKRLFKIINHYLEVGITAEVVVSQHRKGTPRRGPFSPLFSNILLDDFDKDLARRGHKLCRSADDCR